MEYCKAAVPKEILLQFSTLPPKSIENQEDENTAD